ncbi:MAG: thiamine phosphate synthase [Bacillota bacterium]
MSAERSRWRLRGLYAITPEEGETDRLLERVAACLSGGAGALQYRAKSSTASSRLAQARALAALCRSHAVPFIVNDSLELALEIGADGLHLGRDDGDVAEARKRFAGLLGVSCYDELERARAAVAAGADYVAFGSVFASATKPAAVHAPLALLREAKRTLGRPIVAIGGITARNARAAIDAGADMVAVISAVFDAPDVGAAARRIARLFDNDEANDDVRAQPRAL